MQNTMILIVALYQLPKRACAKICWIMTHCINLLPMRNKSQKISLSGHSSYIYKKEEQKFGDLSKRKTRNLNQNHTKSQYICFLYLRFTNYLNLRCIGEQKKNDTAAIKINLLPMRNKIHKISKKTTTYENTTNQYVFQTCALPTT